MTDENKRHREHQRRRRCSTRHNLLQSTLLEALCEPITAHELTDKLYPDDPSVQHLNTLYRRLQYLEDVGLAECIGRTIEGGKWLRNLYVAKGGE